MRVGLVTFYFPPFVRGGAHLSAYYITLGLARKGHQIHVFTANPPSWTDQSSSQAGWLHPDIHRHEIFPIAHPTTSWGMDYGSFIMARQLRHYLKQHSLKFDILHAYGMDTIPAVVKNRQYGHPTATINGYWGTCPFWDHTDPLSLQPVKICTTQHIKICIDQRSSHQHFLRRWLKWRFLAISQTLRRYYMKQLDLILPISYSIQDILLANGFNKQKMQVCYNMINRAEYEDLNPTYLHERFNLNPQQRVLLYAGRFAPYKGTDYILEAIPSVVDKHPKAHFVFIGQGAMLPTLEKKAQDRGLSNYVTFGGFVDPKEMPHAYASAYGLLHTATWPEPFARGPIEGMAAGTAVIGTATGGTPEVITDRETGLIIPPFDANAIANACNYLLANPALRNRLAENSRKLVHKKFSVHNQIEAYIQAYESIL